MEGFFPSDLFKKSPLPLVAKCHQCGLYKTCRSPKMGVSGRGERKILILGESPGVQEDNTGKPFVGPSGQLLEESLNKCGVNLRRDCWITNALICRPKNNKISDNRAIDWCRPNLLKTLEDLKPDVIIPLGATAVKSLIGWLWKEDTGGIARWVGWQIPCQRINAWICPNWHPSYLLRSDEKKTNIAILRSFFDKYISDACSLENKPWKTVPDYQKHFEIIYDHEAAAKAIREFISVGKTLSFDFETDRLKPDHSDARIVCNAISDGKRTIAYPMYGDAVEATGDLLLSNIPKMGYACKFEDRWCLRTWGHKVKHWISDGMLNAHLLDNRTHITGLKFQAFVRLGVESYDDEIKPFMKTKNSNEKNKLHQVPLKKLLVYNAMDAFLEHKVVSLQMKEFDQ